MKKLLALLLALIMVFSLCACTDSGSGSGKKDDEEEEEKTEYPIEVEFNMMGMPCCLIIEESKDIRLEILQETITEEELADETGVEVESATVKLLMIYIGTYKEKKGVYTATFTNTAAKIEITGKDKAAAREALEIYLEGYDDADIIADLIAGKEVDMTDRYFDEAQQMVIEIDGDKMDSLLMLEDGEVEYAYTFHSNGCVKKGTEYNDGEPWYYYEYDKNGELTGEGYVNGSAVSTQPTDEQYWETQTPTYTEPEEMTSGWVTEYYSNGNVWTETYYENGIVTAYWEYYSNGMNSVYWSYYSDGTPAYFCYWDEACIPLEEGSYYDNGNLQYYYGYQDGVMVVNECYYWNGNLEMCILYTADGAWDEYQYRDESGQLREYEDYEDGQLVYWEYYDANGNLIDSSAAQETVGYIHNDENTAFYSVSELDLWTDGTYHTQDGYVVFICWDAPLNWLGENSLKEYVEFFGGTYFDTTYVNQLNTYMSSDGYVQLTTESYEWLVTTITGNPAWGEDESYAFVYLAYYKY